MSGIELALLMSVVANLTLAYLVTVKFQDFLAAIVAMRHLAPKLAAAIVEDVITELAKREALKATH